MATKIVDLEKMSTIIFIVLAATMLSKNQECDIFAFDNNHSAENVCKLCNHFNQSYISLS